MTGEVESEGGASFLHCSVNGVESRPKLVIVDNTVHLFSMVGPTPSSTPSSTAPYSRDVSSFCPPLTLL